MVLDLFSKHSYCLSLAGTKQLIGAPQRRRGQQGSVFSGGGRADMTGSVVEQAEEAAHLRATGRQSPESWEEPRREGQGRTASTVTLLATQRHRHRAFLLLGVSPASQIDDQD